MDTGADVGVPIAAELVFSVASTNEYGLVSLVPFTDCCMGVQFEGAAEVEPPLCDRPSFTVESVGEPSLTEDLAETIGCAPLFSSPSTVASGYAVDCVISFSRLLARRFGVDCGERALPGRAGSRDAPVRAMSSLGVLYTPCPLPRLEREPLPSELNASFLMTGIRLGELVFDKSPLLPDFPNGGLVERDPDLGR